MTTYTNQSFNYDQHQVNLTGLEPETEYCYRIEVDGIELASGLHFKTAPLDDGSTNFSFIAL